MCEDTCQNIRMENSIVVTGCYHYQYKGGYGYGYLWFNIDKKRIINCVVNNTFKILNFKRRIYDRYPIIINIFGMRKLRHTPFSPNGRYELLIIIVGKMNVNLHILESTEQYIAYM
eukprot:140579_1